MSISNQASELHQQAATDHEAAAKHHLMCVRELS